MDAQSHVAPFGAVRIAEAYFAGTEIAHMDCRASVVTHDGDPGKLRDLGNLTGVVLGARFGSSATSLGRIVYVLATRVLDDTIKRFYFHRNVLLDGLAPPLRGVY
jgi:hypothetical protein